jgi:lipopolysaccharide biosynthesis regulator YciM
MKQWIFGALIFSLVASSSAGIAETAGRNSKNLAERAEDLVLKSKRKAALVLLAGEWRISRGAVKAALASKMDELARVFLSENGQKSFELGQSMSLEKAAIAESHYMDALKSEDGNVNILMAIAALRIREKNWNQALDTLETVLKTLPSSSEARLWRIETLLAAAKTEDAKLELEAQGPELEKTDLEELQTKILVHQEKWAEAAAKVTELLKRQPENPELYLLKFKIEQAEQKSGYEPAQKYLELCKKLSPVSQKQLSRDPFKCFEEANVAKILDEFESQTR